MFSEDKMKKRYIILTACVLLLAAMLVSCQNGNGKDTDTAAQYCIVSFDTWGGSKIDDVRVISGNKIAEPVQPEKDGFVFNGWSYKGKDWTFDRDAVTEDITLSAKWVDVETLYELSGDVSVGFTVTAIKKTYANMVVPASVRGGNIVAVGDGAFEGINDEVKSITLADTVTFVGDNAFKDVKVEITVKGALTHIGESAFSGCTELKSIKLGEGLTTIPPAAFLGCSSLVELVLPSTLEKIDENAFEDCTSVKAIIMHKQTETVCDGAFFNMPSLEVVYYYGTAADVDAIDLAVKNDDFEDVIESNVYFYSAEKPSAKGKYWYLSDSGKIRIWEDK